MKTLSKGLLGPRSLVTITASGLLVCGLSQGCAQGIPGKVVPVRVYQSNYTGVDKNLRAVVRDDSTWKALWVTLRDPSAPADTPPPSISFATAMAIVVVGPPIGVEDSVTVEIAKAGSTGDWVVVSAFKVCAPPDLTIMPVHVVQIPRAKRKVRFTEKEIRGDTCPDPGVTERKN